ncbi:STAS domain-containing protein [Saccharothrix australiensis]|uniref:Anti-sigma factor antagonist n=1 Tax=Saccharothrix australiensis TaxID=2072 RepID=A0A495W3W8_9PSEU|nr:STAS domain-containing protein [Saccharothrix australiensis]RKT55363.1 anti-anti-sigma factor [Saccharothrix australiensis]
MREDSEGMAVTVGATRRDGVVVAEVRGGIDTENCRQVRDELFACLRADAGGLVVDLDGVGFFGSLGIAVLVEVWERAGRSGIPLAVVAGRRAVARPMRLTEVDELLALCQTVDEAVAAVRDRAARPPVEPGTDFSWWGS